MIPLKECAVPGCPNEFPEHYIADVCGARHSAEEKATYDTGGNRFDQVTEARKRDLLSSL